MIRNLTASFPPGKGGLSPAQVKTLIGALDDTKMAQGRVGPMSAGLHVVDEIRSGSVQWLKLGDVGAGIFSHLFTLAVVTNRERSWDFDIRGISPALQATRYSEEGGQHYTWHLDWGLGPTRNRKIAAVVHLSDEAEFEGGQLQLTNGRTPVNAVQASGTVTVFPAFLMHRVTPVTRGVRLAVVAWIVGPSYR